MSRIPHRPRTWTAVLTMAVALTLAGPAAGSGSVARAFGPVDSSNLLDHPRADVATLSQPDPDGAPRLLVVDPIPPGALAVDLAILERDRSWAMAEAATIQVPGHDGSAAAQPWLVGVGGDRFVLFVPSAEGQQTTMIGVDVTMFGGEAGITTTKPIQVDGAVRGAAAVDISGDGRHNVIVQTMVSSDLGVRCEDARLTVFDAATLDVIREHDLVGRTLGTGVIGSFDDLPGDDLIAYAGPGCWSNGPVGPPATELIGIHLADGTISSEHPIGTRDLASNPPIRSDVDGDGAHEVLAFTERGLAVMDPRREWAGIRVATSQAIPLVATDLVDTTGAPATRVAWLEPARPFQAGSIGTQTVRRDPTEGDLSGSAATVMFAGSMTTDRWTLIQADAERTRQRSQPATALVGAIAEGGGCADVLLPGAVVHCDDATLQPGAAWVATRPLSLFGGGGMRTLLVGSGVAWDQAAGLVDTPTPWAGGSPGWWRTGPSAPFVIAQLRARDTTYFQTFPSPRATVERATAPDSTTAIPGFTGVRLLVTATAMAIDALEPPSTIRLSEAIAPKLPASARAMVARVNVPPGVDAGRDGSNARVPLDGATYPDGTKAERWTVTVVPINDYGEVGSPVVGSIVRDRVSPSVSLAVPFTSPFWPAVATLHGEAEVGAVVSVDGLGDFPVDRRGRFEIETSLAPWPQTLVVTATDPSGNSTAREYSVIGGVDYRQFPWPAIMVSLMLLVVIASGFRGTWRRRGSPVVAVAGSAWEDGPAPEIEELPVDYGVGGPSNP